MPQKVQLSIFEQDDFTIKLRDELKKIDLNTMTPMDALWKLNELLKLL
jgi:DNA mismatch repair protein MutS